MRDLLLLLRDLCLLRRGPQDLPYAPQLTAVVVVLSVLVQFANGVLVEPQVGLLTHFLAPATTTILSIGILYVLLNARSRAPRLLQTVLADAAVTVVFTIAALVLIMLIGGRPPDPQQMTAVQKFLALVIVAIAIWRLAVMGHILRHALEVPFAAALLIAVLSLVAQYIFAVSLFGRVEV
jgi:hypothetical protein